MPDASRSRVDAGRRRAATAKRAVALAAAGGFVVLLGVARHAHPGSAAVNPSRSQSSGVSSSAAQGLSLGGGSLGPSSSGGSSAGSSARETFSVPQVQTSTS